MMSSGRQLTAHQPSRRVLARGQQVVAEFVRDRPRQCALEKYPLHILRQSAPARGLQQRGGRRGRYVDHIRRPSVHKFDPAEAGAFTDRADAVGDQKLQNSG